MATTRIAKRTAAASGPLKGRNKKADHRAIITGLREGALSSDINLFILSYLLFQIFAEKALRFNKQYYYKYYKSVGILVFT